MSLNWERTKDRTSAPATALRAAISAQGGGLTLLAAPFTTESRSARRVHAFLPLVALPERAQIYVPPSTLGQYYVKIVRRHPAGEMLAFVALALVAHGAPAPHSLHSVGPSAVNPCVETRYVVFINNSFKINAGCTLGVAVERGGGCRRRDARVCPASAQATSCPVILEALHASCTSQTRPSSRPRLPPPADDLYALADAVVPTEDVASFVLHLPDPHSVLRLAPTPGLCSSLFVPSVLRFNSSPCTPVHHVG